MFIFNGINLDNVFKDSHTVIYLSIHSNIRHSPNQCYHIVIHSDVVITLT